MVATATQISLPVCPEVAECVECSLSHSGHLDVCPVGPLGFWEIQSSVTATVLLLFLTRKMSLWGQRDGCLLYNCSLTQENLKEPQRTSKNPKRTSKNHREQQRTQEYLNEPQRTTKNLVEPQRTTENIKEPGRTSVKNKEPGRTSKNHREQQRTQENLKDIYKLNRSISKRC